MCLVEKETHLTPLRGVTCWISGGLLCFSSLTTGKYSAGLWLFHHQLQRNQKILGKSLLRRVANGYRCHRLEHYVADLSFCLTLYNKKTIGIKMKVFSEVKRPFLGIFCDVWEIQCFGVLPQVSPQISKPQNSL